MVTRTLALTAFVALTPLVAAAQSQQPAPVQAQELGQLDAWSVSAITREQGAFAPELWQRSDPAMVAALFDRLPATFESPAAQTLARRVLLSGGAAPPGDATDAARRRFEALGRMGAADELAVMAAGAGASLSDPLIAQYAAQAELARGRRAEACTRGRNASAGESPPPFLFRLRAYCAAVTGDRAAADLALELSRGARAPTADDNWYSAAVGAAAGAPPARATTARYDNSLTTQLSIAGQLRPGPNALQQSSTLALVALARNENAPQPHRAQAAALAFRRGALPAAEARTILLATPAEITSGLPPILIALRRVEAARAAPTAGAAPTMDAAPAIAEVLRSATSPADFTATALFFRTDIANLATAPDQAAAVLFARAALATGDVRLAQRLVGSARQAGADEATLAPLDAALAALTGPRGEQALRAMHRRIDAGGTAGARAAARDVAILAALGAPVDGAVQRFILANPPQGGARAESGALLALASAAERGATGEAALLAVAAVGEGGLARLDTESVVQIIRGLRAARLEDDARRFAAEAILAGAPR